MPSESFKSIISQKFIELTEKYLNTGNPDSYFSGHNGQLIDLLRTLEEDNKFNMDMLYKEGFMTKAVLDESIDNWSTYLNYNKGASSPSKAKMILILSVNSDVAYRVTIPKDTQWTIGSIIYTLTTTLNIINFGSNKLFIYKEDGEIDQLPYKYVYNSGTKTYDLLVKKIPLEQYEIVSNTFTFPNITTFEFKSYQIKIKGGNQIFGIDVTVDGESFVPITTFQDFKVEPKSALYSLKGDTLTVTFGNGILGFLPFSGSVIIINAKLTLGAAGAVASGDIVMDDPNLILYGNNVKPEISAYIPENAIPGVDTGVEVIKANAIADFRTNRRFVTPTDFEDFFQLLGLVTPVYIRRTRADMVKTNVSAFLTIPDVNITVAPTSTENITIPLPVAQIENMVIPKGGQVLIDGEFTYSVPYELYVSTFSSFVSYRNRPNEPEAVFKLVTEYANNNSTEAFFSMADSNTVLDDTYPLLGQDKMKYTVKLFHIFNDQSLQNGPWELLFDITSGSGTISESALVDEEFRSGNAVLDTSGGGDFSSWLNGIKDSPILDTPGTGNLAVFASNLDIGSVVRLVKFNQGYEPPSPAPQIISSYITSKGSTAPVSFTKDTIIRYKDYLKFDVIIDKNKEDIKLLYTVSRILALGGPLTLMKYSINISVFRPLDIELLSSSSVSTITDITINNVPLIESVYYEENIADIDNFLIQIGDVIQSSYTDKRMQNVDINIKFSKTYGKLKNIFLNTKDKIYTFDPEWNPRIFFDIDVFISPLSKREPTIVVEDIKLAVLAEINNSKNYHRNVITSKIQTIVQSIPEVEFVRIVSPVDNIIYAFDVKQISKVQMQEFVPEYIYTTYDSINVNILTTY